MEQGEWLTCVVNPAYEIQATHPHRLRDKSSKQLVREWVGRGRYGKGYVQCWLGGRKWLKHRIVAQQWIPNPDNLPQVDHKNRIRTDNRIENLRWCSASENMRNRTACKGSRYNYVEQLPETTQILDSYNGHTFEGLYIDRTTQKLYMWNGCSYRELNNGCVVIDTDHKHCRLHYNKLFTNEEEED